MKYTFTVTGWLPYQAIRIANAVSDLDFFMEQPCISYDECLKVRQHTNLPFILDENLNSVDALLRLHSDKAADVVNLKISKLGGLTKTKQVKTKSRIIRVKSDLKDCDQALGLLIATFDQH